MLSKNKGQISLEFLIILGVIILAVVIFATYYLGIINKNLDKSTEAANASQINLNIEREIVLPTTTAPSASIATCGNGSIDAMEVCDTAPAGAGTFPAGLTCNDIPYSLGGTRQCINCLEITCN